MLIALTGTPGTGKTSLSEVIRTAIDVVHIGNMRECFSEYDDERGSYVVDMECVERRLNGFSGVVEGHTSHLLRCVDLVVVLRAHPDELRRRLEARGYPPSKIRENVEAEAMGLIVSEAVNIHGVERVVEIDTTERGVDDVAEIFWKALKTPDHYRPRVDYMEEILKWY